MQETPTSRSSTQQHVFFENTVHIQTPLSALPPESAIFFEFKHWKAKKGKVGVVCDCVSVCMCVAEG